MNHLPEIETQSKEKIKVFQNEKLIALLNYLSQNSPYYRRLFSTHNISVDSIHGVDDLVKIPVTTKNDLQQHNWDFLCVPRNLITEYTTTSGTLGKPVTIAITQKDVERLAYNEYISFACANGSSSDVYQLMLTLDRQFMAGMAYYEGIRKLGAGLIRVGPGLPAMQLETMERLKPTALVAVPSFILKLIDYAKQQGIDLNASSVQKIICIGETIRTGEFELNTIAKKIREFWNVQLFGTYASTEMQTAFTECEHGCGGHHHPELLIVELLDENNQHVKDGELGEVTICTLGVEGMPLLRYKTGDVATKHEDLCACGRTTLRLGPIVGRKQQMIKLRGTTLYPPGIFEILNQFDFVTDYIVEAYTNDVGLDEIKIYLVAVDGQNSEALVKSNFQSRLRIVPEIKVCSQQEVDVMHAQTQNRKLQRFIDRRV